MVRVIHLIEEESGFLDENDQRLFDQLERVKCKKLLETINYVVKILRDMEKDDYRFTAKTYDINIEQLLSYKWLLSDELQKYLDAEFISEITDPFASRVLQIDNKVISKIYKHLLDIKTVFDKRLEEKATAEQLLSPDESDKVRKNAEKITEQCWWFFRGVKLYESTKILLRAIEEHDEFMKNPDLFKGKYKKMYIPIEVHE